MPQGLTTRTSAFTVPDGPETGDPNRPLFAVLKGHFVPGVRRNVMALAFRPDGKMLATGDDGGLTKLWALPSCEEKATLRGTAARIAFSPDGKILASATSSGVKAGPRSPWDSLLLTLWDTASWKRRTEGDRLGVVCCLAFNPDGKTIAIGHVQDGDRFLPGTLTVWDVAAAKVAGQFVLPDARIISVAYTSDGKCLAALDHTGWIRLLSPVTCTETKRFLTHGQVPKQIGFAPDGESLFSTEYYSAVPYLELWDVRTGKRKAVLEPREDPYKTSCAVFLPNAPVLAAGTITGCLELRDARTFDLLVRVQAHEGPSVGVHAIAVSKDGKLIATGGGDGLVKLWNVQALLKQRPNDKQVSGVLPTLAVASNQDGRIQAFSINANVIETTSQKTCGGKWNGWASVGSPNGNTAATEVASVQGPDGLIYVFAKAGQIYMARQTATNAQTWTAWSSVAPQSQPKNIGKFTVALNSRPGRAIQIFATVNTQVATNHLNPSNGTWAAWSTINAGVTGHHLQDIAVAEASSGSLLVAGIDDQAAGHVWVATQKPVNPTAFSAFSDLGAPGLTLQQRQVQLARNGINNIVYVMTLGPNNSVWYNRQTPAGGLGTWASLGDPGVPNVTVQQVVPAQNEDGSLYVFAKGSDHKVYGNKQGATMSGGWAGFVAIGGNSPEGIGDIAVGMNGATKNNTDPNCLEVFGVVNNKLYSTWQAPKNSTSWADWHVQTHAGY